MTVLALSCPSCGAPVPPEARGLVACAYCGSTLAAEGAGGRALLAHVPDQAAARWNDRGHRRVGIAGKLYVVIGKLAEGETSDVFLARRDALLTEMVVLKVVRALADGDALEREWQAIEALERSEAKGADYFSGLLPQRVGHGPLATPDGLVRRASVFRWRSGFQHTLAQVLAAHRPAGVDPRTGVWMWKRLLEMLGWVHESGWVHGAVSPEHVLVHPRDHGIVLCGWSSARRATSPSEDIAMSARCVIEVMGGDPERGTLPLTVPESLGRILATYADASAPGDRTDDAWKLMEQVGAAGHEAFGEPRFHPFTMPGW